MRYCNDCATRRCRCGVSAPIPDDPEPIGFARPRCYVEGWTAPEVPNRKALEALVRAYRRGSKSAEEELARFADPWQGLDLLASLYGKRIGFGTRTAAAERSRIQGGAEFVAGYVESVASRERKAKRESRKIARVLDVRAADLGAALAEAADGLAPWIVVPMGHPASVFGLDRKAAAGLLKSLRRARSVEWRLDLTPVAECLRVSYVARRGQRGEVRLWIRPILEQDLRDADAAPPEIPHEWIHPPA